MQTDYVMLSYTNSKMRLHDTHTNSKIRLHDTLFSLSFHFSCFLFALHCFPISRHSIEKLLFLTIQKK
uniref:Putative ovule protein n=1 Tax=Solanum chacoense TaxID=4108 RepID=A0A0V0GN83_SOLCH